MELVQWQMQSIHGLAVHSPESNKSSRWSLMDLVHMATCSIRWPLLWSTESINIRQNQEENLGPTTKFLNVCENFARNVGHVKHYCPFTRSSL